MKLFSLVTVCVGLWTALPAAHGKGGPPPDGTLVTCGNDRVAIFGGTVSPDGLFAAGWTLRPKPGKPPVKWSTYDPKDPAGFVGKFNPEGSVDFPSDGDYTLLNGLLNLATKTFTPLTTTEPNYPGEPRCYLYVVWSDERDGTRFAAVSNVVGSNHSEGNADLLLAEVGSTGVRFVDLQPAADKAVTAYMHRRDPKDYKRYQWSYDFEDGERGHKPLTVFRDDLLTIHFRAQIFLEANNLDSGRVTVSLPSGTVTGTTTDK